MSNVDKYIDQIGVWNLRKHGVKKLADNNPAESINAMLRRDANNQERLIDEMVLFLYKACAKKHNEILRALNGTGEFRLKECLKDRYSELLRNMELEHLPVTMNELHSSLESTCQKKTDTEVKTF